MDNYTLVLLLGGIGLVAMALTGLGRHGHDSGAHGLGHGHAGHGHDLGLGHGHVGHGHDLGHGHAGHHGADGHAGIPHLSPAWQLMSPRIIFSVLLGVGVTGKLLQGLIGGIPLLVLAIIGGFAFERFLVVPIWNFVMRFGSNPALTLESAVMGEAMVVSNFDANGHGLVAIEVDGHVVQLLATLPSAERATGARVRAGERVRIEEIDAGRNRCIVTRL